MSDTPLRVRPVPEPEWPAVSGAFRDLTYEQTLTYGQAAARRIGGSAAFCAIEDARGETVAAACLRRKSVPGLSRGIVWIAAGPLTRLRAAPPPGPDRLAAILDALRGHVAGRGEILRLRLPAIAGHDTADADAAAARAGFRPTDRAAPYRSVIIDLERDESALMAALHGKWRNPLRNALKSGLDCDRGPLSQMWPRFRLLYLEVQQAKGFQPDITPEFYLGLDGPDFDHEVLIARKDGADIAGMTIGRAGGSAVYLFGATAEPGRKLNAGHFLMWQAILRGRERGLETFDLGGIDAEANPSVTRFKLRTGGTEVRAPGPYEARGTGPLPALIVLAETVRSRVKGRA